MRKGGLFVLLGLILLVPLASSEPVVDFNQNKSTTRILNQPFVKLSIDPATLFCALTGCTIDGDVIINGNLTVTNFTWLNITTINQAITINITDNITLNGTTIIDWNDIFLWDNTTDMKMKTPKTINIEDQNIINITEVHTDSLNLTVNDVKETAIYIDHATANHFPNLDATINPIGQVWWAIKSASTVLGTLNYESDGTGIGVWANWFVIDGLNNYWGIDINGFNAATSPIIGTATAIGIGVIPTTKLQIAGNTWLDGLNDKLLFGNNKDGAIYHDGSEFIFDCANFAIFTDQCRFIANKYFIFESKDGTVVDMMFDGTANDGWFQWSSNDMEFKFFNDMKMNLTNKFLFNTDNNWMMAFNNQHLNINSQEILNISIAGNEVLHIDGNGTTTTGDINQTGNFTGNQIYAFKYAHPGGITDIVSTGVYANITNLTNGEFNGFESKNNETFKVLIPGLYHITSQFSFNGGANTEYHLALGINGESSDMCHAERKIANTNDVGSASYTCLERFDKDDMITVMAENINNLNDFEVHDIQFNIWRVGH